MNQMDGEKPGPRSNRKLLLVLAVLVASLGLALMTGSALLRARKASVPAEAAPKKGELERLGKVPTFTLTSEQGKPVSTADLLGKVWIADFIFLRCGGSCPVMTAQMASLAEELKDVADLRFVSFDVDPEHDSVEDMARYAKTYKADPARWMFLRGERPEIRRIAQEGFKLSVVDGNADDPEPILHSSRFILVDRCGEIRGYFESAAPTPILAAARKLAKESCP